MVTAKGHHKTSNDDKNFIVRFFYSNYPFFAYCCAGTEFYYIALVALKYAPAYYLLLPHITLYHVAHYVLAPAAALKNVVNLAQLQAGAQDLVNESTPEVGKKSAKSKRTPTKSAAKTETPPRRRRSAKKRSVERAHE